MRKIYENIQYSIIFLYSNIFFKKRYSARVPKETGTAVILDISLQAFLLLTITNVKIEILSLKIEIRLFYNLFSMIK